MKKELICAVLAVMLLASCSGKGDDGDGTTERVPETVGVSDEGTNEPEETEPENVKGNADREWIEIPTLPEGEAPELGDDIHVQYTDDSVVIYVDGEGTSYVNGEVFPKDDVSQIMCQLATSHAESIKAEMGGGTSETSETSRQITTVSPPKETGTSSSVTTTGPVLPDLPVITEPSDGGEFVYNLAQYVKTGDTGLAITDVKIYNSAKPGVEGVDAFKSGDTILINLWCNTDAVASSSIYIVREEADHKASYEDIECLSIHSMSEAFVTGVGQLFMEITVPDNIPSGIYELRFCSGGEEGYIPFYFS